MILTSMCDPNQKISAHCCLDVSPKSNVIRRKKKYMNFFLGFLLKISEIVEPKLVRSYPLTGNGAIVPGQLSIQKTENLF